MAFWAAFDDPLGELSCVVEDDDRVAYAYLADATGIVADVWLYNVVQAAGPPEWSGVAPTPPFLNPSQGAEGPVPRLTEGGPERLRCDWADGAAGRVCRLFLDDQLWAILVPGACPGWSRLAAVSNAVARRLDEFGGAES